MYVVKGEIMSKDSITEASEILIPSYIVISEPENIKRRSLCLRWLDEFMSEAIADEGAVVKAEASAQEPHDTSLHRVVDLPSANL